MRRPVGRTALRTVIGGLYHRLRRWMQWHAVGIDWAHRQSDPIRGHTVFHHSSPLIRQLPDVDMWMQRNKVHNLALAARTVHGVLLQPGERFSFWRCIGPPVRRRGYLPGMVLQDGQVQPGVGGGLCQLSNLIYWMTLHTELSVVERHRHSYDVFPDTNRTVPFGSGATCAYSFADLQVENRTSATYQLLVQLTDHDLVGEWRADREPSRTYRVYQDAHWITHEPAIGHVRHNTIRRRVYEEGEVVDDEFITENHARMMYPPFLAPCNPDPATSLPEDQ